MNVAITIGVLVILTGLLGWMQFRSHSRIEAMRQANAVDVTWRREVDLAFARGEIPPGPPPMVRLG